MEQYDLVVIGSGPAGYAAAIRAFDFNKSVCVIEGGHLGGTGIVNGALTSKTMWELSKDYFVAASVDRGYRASGLTVDFKEVKKTVMKAAKTKQYQLLSQIETFSKLKSKKGNLTLKKGWGKFVEMDTIEISNEDGKELIKGKDFIIATGSRPRDYPEIDIDGERILTSDHILNLKEFPERMIIIGSGIIGCEFASIFSNFKQTEVHLLDRTHRVLPFEDDDVSDFVSKNLENNGVKIHYEANLRTIKKHTDHLEVILDYDDGHSKVLEVDVALVSIGRVPNFENLGLEKIGISATERGFLKINEYCMIKDNPNKCQVFAAGDITGHSQLYSIAEHQGRNAVEAIYNHSVYMADYSSMPTLMFFKPEVAAVGMNEKRLQRKEIPYKVVTYSNDMVNRAIAMRSTSGFVKIIISDDDENRILGMRAAGPQASAFIISVAHFINQQNVLKDVLKVIHPHPSITEGIQDSLRVFDSKSLFKPEAFPKEISIRKWNPEKNK
jgi:dihydrolipoyl dehydrogenase